MRSFIKYFLFNLFIFLSAVSLAQDDNTIVPSSGGNDSPPAKEQYYLLSPRVSVTVPHPMANRSFKKSFVGIYELTVGMNLYVYKGFFIGVSGKNGLLKITENRITDYNASMGINNVAGKFGGDWHVGEKKNAIFSLAFSAGHNWSKYMGLMHKQNSPPPLYTKFETNYIEPEMNIFFLIESNFAIGATFSYTIFNTHFDPYDLDLNEYSKFSRNNAAATQFLSFGFGFYYSLLPKKK